MNFVGTVITAVTVASGGTTIIPIIVDNTHDPFNRLVVINAAATNAIATFMIRNPMGASVSGFITVSTTATTITSFSVRLAYTSSISTTTTPSPHEVFYNADGTMDKAKTIHADYLIKQPDGVDCPCVDCVSARQVFDDSLSDESNVVVWNPNLGAPYGSVRPKDKTIRFGEAKNPGPGDEKSAPLIFHPPSKLPAHNCTKKKSCDATGVGSFRAPSSFALHSRTMQRVAKSVPRRAVQPKSKVLPKKTIAFTPPNPIKPRIRQRKSGPRARVATKVLSHKLKTPYKKPVVKAKRPFVPWKQWKLLQKK